MNKLLILSLSVCFSLALWAKVDNVAKWDPNMAASTAKVDTNGVKWIDGQYLPLEGRWTLGDTPEFYARLPNTLTTNVNEGVRGMRIHTAGMQFRFKTDSKFIVVKYESASGQYGGSGNQTGINVHGWDIYSYDEKLGKWRFVTTSHNSAAVHGSKAVIRRVNWGKGACLINLPAYDGVKRFEIGIEPSAKIEALPARKSGITKPVVFYGTSITHGASASRPGLGFVNLVGRDLDVPIYNLGFSGSGRMEYELSDVIAKIDASCYVLDCLWNMNEVRPSYGPGGAFHDIKNPKASNPLVRERYEPFIRNLRKLRPNVPIVMAEQCDVYEYGRTGKDKLVFDLYQKLKKEGWTNLVYLSKTKMYTDDLEGTADGCHPNDLGMKSMSKAFGGAVKEALGL